jgi:hypothetical protein
MSVNTFGHAVSVWVLMKSCLRDSLLSIVTIASVVAPNV